MLIIILACVFGIQYNLYYFVIIKSAFHKLTSSMHILISLIYKSPSSYVFKTIIKGKFPALKAAQNCKLFFVVYICKSFDL